MIVTQWVQAKLDKLVTSLSQLLINYYRVKMNVQQTIKTSRPKADYLKNQSAKNKLANASKKRIMVLSDEGMSNDMRSSQQFQQI